MQDIVVLRCVGVYVDLQPTPERNTYRRVIYAPSISSVSATRQELPVNRLP